MLSKLKLPVIFILQHTLEQEKHQKSTVPEADNPDVLPSQRIHHLSTVLSTWLCFAALSTFLTIPFCLWLKATVEK